MKNLTSILLFIVTSTINSWGQETLIFSKVISTDSVGKAKLFATINDWFASTYNSANDVIQMTDKEEGIIVGNGSMSYSYGKMAYLCYEGYIKYTIKVYVKDNRYKVELTNFNHSVKPGNASSCSLGLITNSEVHTTTGMSKNYHNNTWNDIKIKVEQYSSQIFESLDKKTKNIKSDKDKSDW